MKLQIVREHGNTTTHENVQCINVDTLPGQAGQLVLFTGFSKDECIEKIPVWDWSRILITKDLDFEKV